MSAVLAHHLISPYRGLAMPALSLRIDEKSMGDRNDRQKSTVDSPENRISTLTSRDCGHKNSEEEGNGRVNHGRHRSER